MKLTIEIHEEFLVAPETLSDKSTVYNVVGNGLTLGATDEAHATRLRRELNGAVSGHIEVTVG